VSDTSLLRRLRAVAASFVGQTVMIVVGVLVAFNFDRWNQTRQERVTTEGQVLALHEDMAENAHQLQRVLRLQCNSLDVTRDFLRRGSLTPPPDTLQRMIGESLSWYRLEPSMAAYEVFVGSGDLTRVSDLELLETLSSFYGSARAGFEGHQESMELATAMRLALAPLGTRVFEPGMMTRRLGLPWGVQDNELAATVRSETFTGLVAQRAVNELYRLGFQGELAKLADSALVQIDQYLDLDHGGPSEVESAHGSPDLLIPALCIWPVGVQRDSVRASLMN